MNVANGVRQTGETAGLDGLDALVAPHLKCFNANSPLKTRENQKFGALVLKIDSQASDFGGFRVFKVFGESWRFHLFGEDYSLSDTYLVEISKVEFMLKNSWYIDTCVCLEDLPTILQSFLMVNG